MIGPTCPKCDVIHGSAEVVCLTRFATFGVAPEFRTTSGLSPSRTTRAEAEADLCAERARSS